MFNRIFWINRIETGWRQRSVIWLSGVRRVGKTVLCQSLPDIVYFDCELPRTRRMMADPQAFLEQYSEKRIVLDEIHRLPNPSELLKIAADHYPQTKILATGSSTLGASAKFRDTLTGRKYEIWLPPMISQDLSDFQQPGLQRRFLRGGLPPFFLAETLPERDFQEWMDAYWAKDIQELFRLERRHSFQTFVELLLVQSGGIFEATAFANPCGVSRPTISNYLKVLESTFVAHVIRPFSTNRQKEIISAPKVYGFDTGFVCYYRGWTELRSQDFGELWEHWVLNELHAHIPRRDIRYWRNKRGNEIDFVLTRRGKAPVAIECKWSAAHFRPKNMKAFRRLYPESELLVVANDVERRFTRHYDQIQVHFVSLSALIRLVT